MDSNLLITKSKKLLVIILLGFSLIFLRVWQLASQDEASIQKKMPARKKTVVEKAPRGQIFDRYSIPLAINKIRYDATVYYNQIKEIPGYRIVIEETGKKVRKHFRNEYIEQFSTLLSDILNLDQKRISDLIHSKASLFPNTAFTIKEHLSEKEYYQLKALEKDYPGLHAAKNLERFYPQEKTGCDILGHLGSIDSREYLHIADKINTLSNFLDLEENEQAPTFPEGFYSKNQVISELKKLEEKSYTLSDLVGKTGIEKTCEEKLRGLYGKTCHEIDLFGHFIQKVPGEKKAIGGNQVKLTISAELQSFAEKLLTEDESFRQDYAKQKNEKKKEPWVRGGAIVALDPNNGQVLALASYPRVNPNDFIPSNKTETENNKRENVIKWLETETYFRDLWDGKSTLSRELFSKDKNTFYTEEKILSWTFFLQCLLSKESKFYEVVKKIDTISKAIDLQEALLFLSYYAQNKSASSLIDVLYPEEDNHQIISLLDSDEKISLLKNLSNAPKKALFYKNILDTYLRELSSNLDKLFVIDLCKICIYSPAFSDLLLKKIGHLSLEKYRHFTQIFFCLEAVCKQKLIEPFHQKVFIPWREENAKTFLKEKRDQEKAKKTYARPYIDYLDQEERKMFSDFWKVNRPYFLLNLISPTFSYKETDPFLYAIANIKDTKSLEAVEELKSLELDDEQFLELFHTFKSYNDLTDPLLTKYPHLKKNALAKDLVACFYPKERFGYGRSYAYSQSCPLGSIFKIVTSYSALKTLYQKNLPLEPFSFFDSYRFDPHAKKKGSIVVGYMNGKIPIPRFYKGGRMPKSHSSYIGNLDLENALGASSNPYFALLTTEVLDETDDLIKACRDFGLGTKTNIDLPLEYKGNLPNDLHKNKTGLYSFAIGQHTLLATPLQTALMLASIANGGKLFAPQIIHSIEGNERLEGPLHSTNFAYKEMLANVGIDFSLFTAKEYNQKKEASLKTHPTVVNEIFLPKAIQEKILNGMDLALTGEKGTARGEKIRYFRGKPELLKEYKELYHQLVGKTSTAEISYNLNANPSSKSEVFKHIWFGAISYEEEKPELVVVVFLRFGSGGKEAAPLASQMVTKYRQIKENHSNQRD